MVNATDKVTRGPVMDMLQGSEGVKEKRVGQGKKGWRGLLSSKTLTLLLTLMLATWASDVDITDPTPRYSS